MFSFHKPRVYRSTQGCCICKAKSSSSRFTDSKKYENDFIKCFQLTTPRRGEICNACVLLVKRFKRLPVGSDRHWGHVVDARVGPGLKSMTKFKKRKEESLLQQHQAQPATSKSASSKLSSIPEKFSKIFKKNKKKRFEEKKEETPGSSDELSLPPSPSSVNSDNDDDDQYRIRHMTANRTKTRPRDIKVNRRKIRRPRRYVKRINDVNFFDESIWIRMKTCCGIVFENKEIGALMIDSNLFTPCVEHFSSFNIHKNLNSDQHLQQFKTDRNPFVSSQYSSISKRHSINGAINGQLPALKKHQLYFKRQQQLESFSSLAEICTTGIYNTEALITAANNNVHSANSASIIVEPPPISSSGSNGKQYNNHQQQYEKASTYLHKIKSDSGKIVKHSLEKINAARLKSAELSVVKSFVKLCTEKPKVSSTVEINHVAAVDPISMPINKQIDPTANKFSDNSSDSGYEESTNEQKSTIIQQVANNAKPKVPVVRPVILANGIKLHVQPQNLVLAANLAGLTQSSIQSNAQKIIQNSTDDRAIFNPAQDGRLVDILTGSNTNGNALVNAIPNPTNLNQKIILVKTKYNNINQAATN